MSAAELRSDVIEFLRTADKPCSAYRIAQSVLGLDGRTSLDVTRVLMDLEREGLVEKYSTRPVTWSLTKDNTSQAKL